MRDRPQNSHPASYRKKKKSDSEAHTNTHSTTTTNSWRRRQTRRELISSPTRREEERESESERRRKTQKNCFYPRMALKPVGPSSLSLSLPPPSLPTACFSLSPYLSLYQSPSAVLLPVGPDPSSTPPPRHCFRCVTSPQTAGGAPVARNYVSAGERGRV